MQLKIQVSKKQGEALQYLTDSVTKELVFGGAKAGGKTYFGCIWQIGTCLTYPGVSNFVARHELNDLRKYTIPSIHEFFSKTGLNIEDYCSFNGQDNVFIFKNGSRFHLIACKYLPSDPMFERFGSMQMTNGWIEEAGEVHSLARQNLRLSIGRVKNDQYKLFPKMLYTCNPKKNWLYSEFYQPFRNNNLPPDKKFIQALVTDNAFRESSAVDVLDSLTDKIARARLRFGEWEYDDDAGALMSYDAINDIFSNDFVKGGKRYLTADIARMGTDKTVIMIWDGLRVIHIETMPKNTITEAATKIKSLMFKYSVPLSQVIVDEDGVGGGVKDILNCRGFINNSSPKKKENFNNLKSQCYFKLAEKVNNHEIYISTQDEKHKQSIKEELEQVKKKDVDKDGKQQVEPKEVVKERLGRSPDFSDTLMMRMLFEIICTEIYL